MNLFDTSMTSMQIVSRDMMNGTHRLTVRSGEQLFLVSYLLDSIVENLTRQMNIVFAQKMHLKFFTTTDKVIAKSRFLCIETSEVSIYEMEAGRIFNHQRKNILYCTKIDCMIYDIYQRLSLTSYLISMKHGLRTRVWLTQIKNGVLCEIPVKLCNSFIWSTDCYTQTFRTTFLCWKMSINIQNASRSFYY
jgi:hypothetical protein